MRLQRKTALVTGATAGIGEAIAHAFAREGAQVVVTGRNEQRGKAVVQAIRNTGGAATFVAADLTSKRDIDRLAKEATEAVGPIDILVNNAGIYPFGPTAEIDEATFDAVIRMNVKGPFYLTAALAPQMAERGAGKIINITTMAAYVGIAGMALYGASKAALAQLTRSWSAEFGPSGVNVNAISPGPTRTPGTAEGSEGLEQFARTLPAGRTAEPWEIAEAAVYLASPQANFVHGITLHVDGGRAAI